jgi:RNA polymerase sigma-70 factor (ECF subfamily)
MITNKTKNVVATRKSFSIHELIRQHHFALVAWLRPRLRVPEDAQDIAQEAYLRMMKYEGAVDINSPLALLHRVAMNIAHDLERSQRARGLGSHVDMDEIDLMSDLPSAERTVDAEERYGRVKQAIETLTPRCRQIFLLSRVKGLSYSEIAEHCGISVKMVEKHISHALCVCMESAQID